MMGQSVERNNDNYLRYRTKPFYYGMSLGGSTNGYKLFRSADFDDQTDIAVVEGISGPSFNVHVIGNLKVGEYFDFRFLPGASFGERSILFQDAAGVNDRRQSEFVVVQMPFQLRFKSEPYKDFRIFIMTGIKYSWDISSNSRVMNAEDLIRLSPNDFQFELGAGFQIFTPFFIFSPEFKVSQGLQNILIFDDTQPETRILQKILSRAFTVSLNLEG